MKFYICLFLLFFVASFSLNAQCPSSSQQGVHVVQPNETLYRIARQYKVSVNEICTWNNITMNELLPKCKQLKIQDPARIAPTEYNTTRSTPTYTAPPPATSIRPPSTSSYGNYRKQQGNRHTVQPGETFAGLADLYGYTEKRFREINPISIGEEVTVGSTLLSTDCACDRVSYNNGSGLGYDGTPTYTNNGGYTQPTTTTYYPPTTTTYNPPTTTTYNPPTTYTPPTTYNPPTTTNTNPQPNNKTTPTNTSPPTSSNSGSSYMKSIEEDMVKEINLMRSNPRGYVKHVQKYAADQKSMWGRGPSPTYLNELINELNNLSPLSILESNQCLYNTARDHGEDQKPLGDINHRGRDGRSAHQRIKESCAFLQDGTENLVGGKPKVRDAVIILLIDEGIASRGHRKALLNPSWKYVACYQIGMVGTMNDYWVQNFGF